LENIINDNGWQLTKEKIAQVFLLGTNGNNPLQKREDKGKIHPWPNKKKTKTYLFNVTNDG
jgi:hypothetical protein